jgi:hypothetical protein
MRRISSTDCYAVSEPSAQPLGLAPEGGIAASTWLAAASMISIDTPGEVVNRWRRPQRHVLDLRVDTHLSTVHELWCIHATHAVYAATLRDKHAPVAPSIVAHRTFVDLYGLRFADATEYLHRSAA